VEYFLAVAVLVIIAVKVEVSLDLKEIHIYFGYKIVDRTNFNPREVGSEIQY